MPFKDCYTRRRKIMKDKSTSSNINKDLKKSPTFNYERSVDSKERINRFTLGDQLVGLNAQISATVSGDSNS